MTTDIKELLAEAQRLVDAADVAADLRATAFAKAVDLLSAPSGSGSSSRSAGGALAALPPIAEKLGLDSADVSEVYFEDGEQLGIGIAATRLEATDARATKQLALLVAGGRQAGGYDDGWTSTNLIREVCRDYGRLDTGNFAATISSMGEEFTMRGKKGLREVRLTRPGWDALANLVRDLTSGRAS